MRPSSRDRIVRSALEVEASAGGAEVTLEAIARAAAVTKQGLMYHFPTKRDLRQAMLEHILDRWETELEATLGRPLAECTTAERIRAYAIVAARGHVVRGENVLFAEALYRADEFDRYAAWTEQWFALPADTPAALRGQWTTAWLAANSLWSALTSGKRPLSRTDVAAVLATIDDLTATA